MQKEAADQELELMGVPVPQFGSPAGSTTPIPSSGTTPMPSSGSCHNDDSDRDKDYIPGEGSLASLGEAVLWVGSSCSGEDTHPRKRKRHTSKPTRRSPRKHARSKATRRSPRKHARSEPTRRSPRKHAWPAAEGTFDFFL